MKQPRKRPNRYIVLTGIGLQMGITIYLAAYLGKWLDQKYGDANTYTIVCTLLGVVISFYSMMRQVKNLND